jgi:hypothetical protein
MKPSIFSLLRLFVAETILLSVAAAGVLRDQFAGFRITSVLALALAVLYALWAAPPTRVRVQRILHSLAARWHALPFAVSTSLALILVAVVLGWNLHFLLQSPFHVDPYDYVRSEDGELIFLGNGFSKDMALQIALHGLQRGCLLCGAVLPDDPVVPIENLVSAADLGLMFFFGLAAPIVNLPLTIEGYRWFVISLIVSGMALAVLIFGLITGPVGAILLTAALLVTQVFLPLPTTSTDLLARTYWAPGWVTMISAVCALAILSQVETTRIHLPGWAMWMLALIWGLVTGFGFLARSETGYISILFAIGVLGYCTFRLKKWLHRFLLWLIFVLGVTIPLFAFQITLASRTAWYQLPPVDPEGYSSHGIWHSAYIGLGYVSNQWGIYWDDSVGAETVEKNCPGVRYVSPSYYSCLRTEFFRVIQADPLLLVRNLLAKTFMIIARSVIGPTAILLSVIVMFFRVRPATVILFGFALLNMIPGLLAVPARSYSQGFYMTIVMLGAMSLVYAFECAAARGRLANDSR